MHTNFDQLAALRMQEHEAYARQSRLQRVASEAGGHRGVAASAGGWVLAHARLIAASASVSIGTAAAAVVFGR
jgi:hypothetical protein